MQKVKDAEVLGVITAMRCEGNIAFLSGGQMDPKLYKKVDAVLKALEGKWDRKKGGHVFPHDAKLALSSVMNDGSFHDLKRDDNLFETPAPLVARMIELGQIKKYQAVLEPSAGRGSIIRGIVGAGGRAHAIELNESHRPFLVEAGAEVIHIADFMVKSSEMSGDGMKYERILMNPPFANQADLAHVFAAYKLLAVGGILVAIMSPGFTFRATKSSKVFKELVEENGEYEDNPDGSFKEVGTNIKTVMVTLRRES